MKNELISIGNDVAALAPRAAVELVAARLPEISKKSMSVFNRQNSQTTLSMMTLTMMTGQVPHRQVRQIMAEIENRHCALAEAQLNLEKHRAKQPDSSAPEAVQTAEARLNFFNIQRLESKIAGSIKDIANLVATYDNLVKKHGIEDWSEEDFERAEAQFHVRRGFELLYRDIIEVGRARNVTNEYLQQFGVHIQVALKEVSGYIQVTEDRIASGDLPDACDLETFLDAMATKYAHCAIAAAERQFGSEQIRPEFMGGVDETSAHH